MTSLSEHLSDRPSKKPSCRTVDWPTGQVWIKQAFFLKGHLEDYDTDFGGTKVMGRRNHSM